MARQEAAPENLKRGEGIPKDFIFRITLSAFNLNYFNPKDEISIFFLCKN